MAPTGIPTGSGGRINPSDSGGSSDDGGGSGDGGGEDFGEELGGDPAGDADRGAGGAGEDFGEELGGDPAGDADRDVGGGGGDGVRGPSRIGGSTTATGIPTGGADVSDVRVPEGPPPGEIAEAASGVPAGVDPTDADRPRGSVAPDPSILETSPDELAGPRDPRYRPNLFSSAQRQRAAERRLEQQLRQRYNDPSIELRPEDLTFEETDDGLVIGVKESALLSIPAVRAEAREAAGGPRRGADVSGLVGDPAGRPGPERQLERELERRTGVDLDPGTDIGFVEQGEQISAQLTEVGVAKFMANIESAVEDVSQPAGGFESVRGGTPRGETDFDDILGRRRRALSVAQLEDSMRRFDTTPVAVEAPAGGFRTVRGGLTPAQELAQQLDRRTETDIGIGDVDFTTEVDSDTGAITLTGELTAAARREERIQSRPLVQLTQNTRLEEVFETGAGIGVDYEDFAAENRRRFNDVVLQREEAREAVEDLGLGDELEEFEDLSAESQAGLGSTRTELGDIGRRFKAAGTLSVAVPLIAAERAGVDTDPAVEAIEDIPSPTEEPEAFAAAAAPVAALEPTPGGELVVGGVLAAGAVATAANRGLFQPEQEVPEDRSLFVSELDIEPSTLDLPELVTPVEESIREGAPALTPPELGRATGREPTFATEVPIPESGDLFENEVPVPEIRAAGAAQELRGARRSIERETRGGRQRDPVVPSDLIPDEPSAIGFGTGIRVIQRPSPRSEELFEVGSGTPFRVEPELGRVLRRQQLQRELEPEIDPFQAAGPGEVSVGRAASPLEEALDRRLDQAAATRPMLDEDFAARPSVDVGQQTDAIADVGQDVRTAVDEATQNVPATTEFTDDLPFEGLGQGFVFDEPTVDVIVTTPVTSVQAVVELDPEFELDPDVGDRRRRFELDEFTRGEKFGITEDPGADIEEELEAVDEDLDSVFEDL